MASVLAVALLALLFTASMIPTPSAMLFPTHAVATPGPLPPGAMPVSLTTPDGVTLYGISIAPVEQARPRTLILGFGGNGWNGSDVAAYLYRLYPSSHVVAFHYRGYRPSTGTPSSKALIADAPLVLDFARKMVPADRTVAIGFSIGSGVAASLAGEGLVDGVILVTPFDSLKAAAADLFPWLPVGLFFDQEMDAGSLISRAAVPVAVLAGERDTLILPARTDGLRRKVRNLVFDRTIDGAGHNDIYDRVEFVAGMREALSLILATDSEQG